MADRVQIKVSMVSIIPNSNKVQFGQPRLQKYAGRYILFIAETCETSGTRKRSEVRSKTKTLCNLVYSNSKNKFKIMTKHIISLAFFLAVSCSKDSNNNSNTTNPVTKNTINICCPELIYNEGEYQDEALHKNVTATNTFINLQYTNTGNGVYPSFSVTSTGVLGLTATADSVNLSSSGKIKVKITGTPTSSGYAIFKIPENDSTYSFSVKVFKEIESIDKQLLFSNKWENLDTGNGCTRLLYLHSLSGGYTQNWLPSSLEFKDYIKYDGKYLTIAKKGFIQGSYDSYEKFIVKKATNTELILFSVEHLGSDDKPKTNSSTCLGDIYFKKF